uniref:4-coumarate--CoA ligase n=1 Tax=Strigomonas galati TaxID=1003336 RepID=T1YUA6_9TRYP|nr:4-coumarate--CoA ligase [Strigomonas galati]
MLSRRVCIGFAKSGAALTFATRCESTTPKIYRSPLPSVVQEAHKWSSMCDYMFDHWKAAEQNKVALEQLETKKKFTYSQLRPMTELVSQILFHKYNVRKNDVVCILLPDFIIYPAVTFGVMRLGAIVTATNPVSMPDQICQHLEASSSKVIITSHLFHQGIEVAQKMYKAHNGEELRVLYVEDIEKLAKDAVPIPSSYTALEEAKPDDVAFLPFSSGTTGTPKGVQLTNMNLVANLVCSSQLMCGLSDDRFLSVLPFFHIFGFTCIMCGGMVKGGTQICMAKYSVEAYVKCIEDYKITGGYVAPPLISSLVHYFEQGKNTHDLSSFQVALSSAAPLSPALGEKFVSFFPKLRLLQGWGMSEMSPAVTVCPREGDAANDFHISGILIPDTELRVVKVDATQQDGADKSQGIDCEEGEEGEIWLRGPQMMKGYLKEEDNAKAFQDGWYRTGDIGVFNPKNGSLKITDRLKELIKYKGFQISPTSLEAEIARHPWVLESVVISVPDPRDASFENPRALVVLKPGLSEEELDMASDSVYDFIKKHQPPHKRLHGGVRIVSSIPKNASGKVLRRDARHQEIEYLKSTKFEARYYPKKHEAPKITKA